MELIQELKSIPFIKCYQEPGPCLWISCGFRFPSLPTSVFKHIHPSLQVVFRRKSMCYLVLGGGSFAIAYHITLLCDLLQQSQHQILPLHRYLYILFPLSFYLKKAYFMQGLKTSFWENKIGSKVYWAKNIEIYAQFLHNVHLPKLFKLYIRQVWWLIFSSILVVTSKHDNSLCIL